MNNSQLIDEQVRLNIANPYMFEGWCQSPTESDGETG